MALSVETRTTAWARETAMRIKMIQASWSDDRAEERQAAVRAEVSRRLKDMQGAERQECLRRLRTHFPEPGEGRVRLVNQERIAPPLPPTPDEALKTLEEAAPGMTEAQRREMSGRLRKAGFEVSRPPPPPPPPGPLPPGPLPSSTNSTWTVPPNLAGSWKLPAGKSVDLAQALRLLEALAADYVRLDAAASKVIEDLKSKAPPDEDESDEERMRPGRPNGLKPKDDLGVTLRCYLEGGERCGITEMISKVKASTGRLVRFLELPGRLNLELARNTKEVLSPDRARTNAERSRSTAGKAYQFMVAVEVDAWKEYLSIWDQQKMDPKAAEGSVWYSPFWGQRYAVTVLKLL